MFEEEQQIKQGSCVPPQAPPPADSLRSKTSRATVTMKKTKHWTLAHHGTACLVAAIKNPCGGFIFLAAAKQCLGSVCFGGTQETDVYE